MGFQRVATVGSGDAAMNDSPVACQNRDVTVAQRELVPLADQGRTRQGVYIAYDVQRSPTGGQRPNVSYLSPKDEVRGHLACMTVPPAHKC